MIEFPETAQTEWSIVADAANAAVELRKRLELDTRIENELNLLRIRYEAKVLHQQELDAEQTPTLEMMTLSNYKANPAAVPADMIEGAVKRDGLTIVLGASGSGKSTLALQMLYSLETGTDWLGQPVSQISGGVGIISYDMDGAMMMDWMAGFPGLDPDKVSVVNAYKRGNPLGVPDMRKKIAQAWRSIDVEVVVIDSFSASFFAQDQNDAAATMSHYRDLKLFALTECGAKSVIVIAHAKDSSPYKARGSSVHHDVADSIVNVVEDPDTGLREVRMTKYRAARGQTQMSPVMVGAPDPITHLVSVDFGAMSLKGMHLPPSAGASVFDLPSTYEDPQAVDEFDEEDEDL